MFPSRGCYCIIALLSIVFPFTASSQYKTSKHRMPVAGEIPVTGPGCFAKAGATYILMKDIASDRSTVFLGEDVTLDLNGYTLRYADGNYQHISNAGFENGVKDWDLSKAPGAKLMNTADVHVFLGEKLMSLQPGDQITSSYINLPVANRSYFAICGVTGRYYHDAKKYPDDEMKLSIYVEDENGKEVKCLTKYQDSSMVSCPVEKKSPRLGGGFVYAHLNNLPAGKYRIRVKADTDCLVDEIDILPAMDAGVSIIEKTTALAHYDHLIRESYPAVIPAFFDYTAEVSTGEPLPGLPAVKGTGTITIKNGKIESGFSGIQSWGIQSSAKSQKIVLDNVQIKAGGISSGAADILWASVKNCRFDVNMPFLIQRHVNICSVIIRGEKPTEISNSEFYGGQGCLSIRGKYSLVHDNLFVNQQTVTNHYSIMGTGDSSKIYNNRFEPGQGSGIYVSRYTEVFNNTFNITTSPPTCEYGREEYSVAAIRLGDYGAAPGSPNASVGNRIHNNKISIVAKNYPQPETYIPMAWGIYYSASGGENYVYENEITVNKTEPSSKVVTAALYICGGPKYFGGQFYKNTITTNVSAAWIASRYGGASNSKLYNNTIIPLNKATFQTFRMGWMGCASCVARDVEFRANEVKGGDFTIDVTDQQHSYTIYWNYKLLVLDSKGKPVKDEEIIFLDNNNVIVMHEKTGDDGVLSVDLPAYSVNGNEKKDPMPYTVKIAAYTKKIRLLKNTSDTITVETKATAGRNAKENNNTRN